MANVQGTFYSATTQRRGVTPVSPPNAVDDPVDPIQPVNTTTYKALGDVTDQSFVGKNGFVPVVNSENVLTLEPLPNALQDGLISGGIVQWTGTGYNFNVSSALARFQGVFPLQSDFDILTLTAADATDPRIDLFILQILFDGDGIPNGMEADFITGTPAATPAKPQINPATQIELTQVLVPALSTAPTLTEEIVYDENTEWTGTSSGTGTANFNSAVNPYVGTVSVETTNIQNGFYIQFNNGSEIDKNDYQTLGFFLDLKAPMPANQNLYITFLNGSLAPVSSFTLLNFDKSSTIYQFIGIALSSISFTSDLFQYIRFSFVRTGGSPTYAGYFLDIVKFEGGINPPVQFGTFLSLGDTPNSYSGQGGKTVTVKADESGLEFVTGGGGGVSSVTGNLVDNTDPANPIVSGVESVAGTGVDNTDPANPVISQSPYNLAQEGATDGQVLTWVTANSRYEPVTPSGGGISGLTVNTIPKATSATTIGNSRLFDDGTNAYFTNQNTNTFFGNLAGLSSDLGARGQTAFGREAGESNVSGTNWVALGVKSGELNTTGSSWLAIGTGTGGANVGGSNWVGIGHTAGGGNTSGGNWVAIGFQAGRRNSNGSNWVAIGYDAARRYIDNSDSANFSSGVYIGFNVRVGVLNATNEIVIGASADGNGSNTTTIGRSATTNNYIFGNFNIQDTDNFILGAATGTKFGTATSQKLAFWNKTPIIQPTTGIAGATRVGGGGATITDTDTFGGYTVAQLAAILINTGLTA